MSKWVSGWASNCCTGGSRVRPGTCCGDTSACTTTPLAAGAPPCAPGPTCSTRMQPQAMSNCHHSRPADGGGRVRTGGSRDVSRSYCLPSWRFTSCRCVMCVLLAFPQCDQPHHHPSRAGHAGRPALTVAGRVGEGVVVVVPAGGVMSRAGASAGHGAVHAWRSAPWHAAAHS